MNSNLESYHFEDFMSDESFQRWALAMASSSETGFWNEYYQTQNDKRDEMDRARQAVQHLARTEPEVDAEHINEAWAKVNEAIDTPVIKMRSKVWIRYAAAVSVLVISAILLIWQWPATYVSYSAGYGEVKNLTLPDGTRVTLNANSEIKIMVDWQKQGERNVWLEKGEAFFEVTKTVDKKPFTVSSSDVLITVLGTEFNVKESLFSTEVMLREGKVSLSYQGNEKVMQPGELATMNKSANQIAIRSVDASKYDSWLEQKLVFDNTSLAEVAEIIESYYGVSVNLPESLESKKLSGEIPNRNLDLLLKALRVTHHLEITHENNTVTIKRPKTKP